MSDFKNKFDKVKEKGKGKVVKGSFGLTFNGVKDNKNSIGKKALSLRKRERAIIIYKRYIIYKKPIYKNLKTYYYTFLKIIPKGEASLART